jgi:hypothetical protein
LPERQNREVFPSRMLLKEKKPQRAVSPRAAHWLDWRLRLAGKRNLELVYAFQTVIPQNC